MGIASNRPGAGTALLPGLGNRPGIGGERPNQLPSRPNNPQERRDNLQNRLESRGDRQDQRQDLRNDRQDNWGDNREDWQDRYQDFYGNHQDWHHGYWHDHAGGWWDHMWDDHTALMAFRTTMWGINRAAYGFGYWGYSNPYYTEPYPVSDGVALDYSQPIMIESAAPATTVEQPAGSPPAPAASAPPGMSDFDAARQAFYQGDYAGALTATNKALAALPNDPIIHEFRALVMFAQGKYPEAAAGLYSVLSAGPGWDWTTLSSLYPNVEVYTQQLRALEAYLRQNPKAADARFVLAYQYLTAGSKDAAVVQLKTLFEQNPKDPLTKQLLVMTAGPEAIGAAPPATEPAPAAPAVKSADLLGSWSAVGSDNTKFAMELNKDGNFVWTYTQGTTVQTVKGVFALDGNVLAMEPESGGVMLAELAPPANGKLDFQLLGAPPGDPGLKFTKG